MPDNSKLTQLIKEELAAAIRRRLDERVLVENEMDAGSIKLPLKRPKSFGRPTVGKSMKTSKAYQKKGRLNKKTGQRVPVKPKSTKRRDGEPTYTSAGTTPNVKKRKIGTKGAKTREAIAKQMMNVWRRGDQCGRDMRDTLIDQLNKKGQPTDRQNQLSKIWAIASDAVAKGMTSLQDMYSQYPNWGWIKTCGPKPKKSKKAKAPKVPKASKKTSSKQPKKAPAASSDQGTPQSGNAP